MEDFREMMTKLEDDWTHSGGRVDMQDEHGQRHEKMLGSGPF